MSTPLAFTLPNPCPVDGNPIVYRGRGRRPIVCSPTCRAEYRRRAAATDRTRARNALAEAERIDAEVAAFRERLAALPPEDYAAYRADYAARRRRAADARAEDAARYWDALDRLATFDDYAASTTDREDDPVPLVELTTQPDGTLRWNDAHALPRAADPAARWLAEHHPHELATFPTA